MPVVSITTPQSEINSTTSPDIPAFTWCRLSVNSSSTWSEPTRITWQFCGARMTLFPIPAGPAMRSPLARRSPGLTRINRSDWVREMARPTAISSIRCFGLSLASTTASFAPTFCPLRTNIFPGYGSLRSRRITVRGNIWKVGASNPFTLMHPKCPQPFSIILLPSSQV